MWVQVPSSALVKSVGNLDFTKVSPFFLIFCFGIEFIMFCPTDLVCMILLSKTALLYNLQFRLHHKLIPTSSPYEMMMTLKPGSFLPHGRHGDSKPPVPRFPVYTGWPYNKGLAPCIGHCIKKLQTRITDKYFSFVVKPVLKANTVLANAE